MRERIHFLLASFNALFVSEGVWTSFLKSIKFLLAIFLILLVYGRPVFPQQFVTDNYVSMPYGTVTTALTAGQREALVLPSFALFPNWEFFIGASLVWEDEKRGAEDHFSTIINVKWEIYENNTKTGGVAMLLGTGSRPGYLNQDKRLDSFNTFQYIVMATLPFLDGMISWDLNPGVLLEVDKDDTSVGSELQFTYATRIAFYGIIPSSAIVGEVYGGISAGENDPEYKAGIRWEPSANLNVALTYGGGPGDERLPGLEIGVLVYAQLF